MNSWYPRFIHTLAAILCAATVCLRAADNPTAPPTPPAPPTAPAAPQPPETPEPPPPPDDDDMADLDLDDDAPPPDGAETNAKPKLNRLEEIVAIGRPVHVRTNETAPTVVVLFQNAQIDGRVGEVVVIGGTATINGRVREQVVTVMGKVKLSATARVGGDVVSIGTLEREEGSKVGGHVQEVPFFSDVEKLAQIPEGVSRIVSELVLLGRPLSFQIGWVWLMFGALMLIHLAFAAVFPRAMERTIETVQTRGAGSFLMGLATLPLSLFITTLLITTVIGLPVVPFAMAAVFMAAMFGKAAVLGFSGRSILSQFGIKNALPLPSILIGSVLLALFYVMPFIGILTWMMATTWGLGAAVIALFSGLRNETQGPTPLQAAGIPPSPAPAIGTMPPGPITHAESTLAVVTPGAAQADPALSSDTGTASSPGSAAPPQPLLPEALTQVRAGFWRKAGAAAIDLAIVSLLSAATFNPPLGFLLWLAYFAAMWTWRGTTIGGLVLGLRVVRVDGRPLDVYTAIVRALGGALGFMICFLGVLWCAWDPERQCWHDKMAGTVVVHTKDIQPLI